METDTIPPGEPSEPEVVESRHKTPFVPGHKIKAKGGSKKGVVNNPPSQILRDMRHVYEKGPGADKTTAQRKLRDMMNKDLKGFLLQLGRLEEGHKKNGLTLKLANKAAAAGLDGKGKRVGPDDGQERGLELIERLLEEYGDGRQAKAD